MWGKKNRQQSITFPKHFTEIILWNKIKVCFVLFCFAWGMRVCGSSWAGSNLSHSSDNVKSLTHCGTREFPCHPEILTAHGNHLKGKDGRVPVVAQQKPIVLVSMRMWVRSLALFSGLRNRHGRELWCRSYHGYGVGWQVQLWFNP